MIGLTTIAVYTTLRCVPSFSRAPAALPVPAVVVPAPVPPAKPVVAVRARPAGRRTSTSPRGPGKQPDCFLDDAPGIWHVLHVRSHQEKIVASDITAMGIACFLPLVQRTSVRGRRTVNFEVPLFPGYVFLRGSLEDAYRCDRTKRVAAILPVADQRTLDWELRNIWHALQGGADLTPHPYVPDGVPVVVRCGPFQGLQGVVARHAKGDRLVLQVKMLGGGTSLELGGAYVEPLPNHELGAA
jgi:transcription antitermination factor NusG